jgi:hypothetical protein
MQDLGFQEKYAAVSAHALQALEDEIGCLSIARDFRSAARQGFHRQRQRPVSVDPAPRPAATRPDTYI